MPSALERIAECIPALRRYAWALLRDGQDADDLVHDCLVRAFDKLHLQQPDSEMRPWLFTIMHNLFVSGRRKARRRGEPLPIDAAGETGQARPPTQENGLALRDLVRGLDALPEEQRVVMLLVCVEDLSYAEVARVLGIPIGTVMSRLSRARERLRLSMEGRERPALRRVK